MRKLLVGFVLTVSTAGVLPSVTAAAATSVVLNGSFSIAATKPSQGTFCSSGIYAGAANECGTMALVGLGEADWAYYFGPTFEPTGKTGCFNVDGTLTLTLRSDGSTVSGPLTGVWCEPGNSRGRGDPNSFGNPFHETDNVAFSGGSGQFEGLSGSATFQTQSSGAIFKGTLKGTLR